MLLQRRTEVYTVRINFARAVCQLPPDRLRFLLSLCNVVEKLCVGVKVWCMAGTGVYGVDFVQLVTD